MWGSVSDSNTETGGGVMSTVDTGTTWAASLANGDATPAGIGAYAYRIKKGGYDNGVYFLLGTQGTFLTSTTGLTASWTARPMKVLAQFCALGIDTTNHVIIAGAQGFAGTQSRTALMFKLNQTGELTGSKTFDTPSVVDAAGTSTTVTVTGAALGDYVTAVSLGVDLQGITVTAYVSAADTVTVRFQNESGGTLDLTSSTLRVIVKGSGTNPAAWKWEPMVCPIPGIKAIAMAPSFSYGLATGVEFIVAGGGMYAGSGDLGTWRKYRPPLATWTRKQPAQYTPYIQQMVSAA